MLERLTYSAEKGLHVADQRELKEKADRYFRRANSLSNWDERANRSRLTKKASKFARLTKWARKEESDD